MSPRIRIACAALLFSTGGAAIKAADFTAWQVASFRSGIAALTLLILVPQARRGIGWKPALVGIAYAATLVLFVLANRLTTSANTIYLQSTAPLYVLLLAPFLLRERIRRSDLPIIAAVFGGLILVFLGVDHPSATAPDPARGNLLAAGSGVTYAFLLIGLRWLGRGDTVDRGVPAVLLGNCFACLAALPMAMPVGVHPWHAWTVILYLGIFQIAGAYLLITSALRHIPAIEASLMLLVETAFNPVWSWLVLGEVPAALALVGGGLIVGATILQAIRAPSPVPVPDLV
ncbi:MAG TPA: DMT family transporter [Gemmatimonadales bacterium]|jgi:drug/metabolite transporter (DMT)-like permease